MNFSITRQIYCRGAVKMTLLSAGKHREIRILAVKHEQFFVWSAEPAGNPARHARVVSTTELSNQLPHSC